MIRAAGATEFTRFWRSRNDFARTSHCARGTSPSIVVHNVAGAARLENYEGPFSASFRASCSLPVTLVGTNNDLEKLKKALSRDYTPGDRRSRSFVVASRRDVDSKWYRREKALCTKENAVKVSWE